MSKSRTLQNGDTVRTVHDEDCPKCGFPETVLTNVLIDGDLKPVTIECSSHKCDWAQKITN